MTIRAMRRAVAALAVAAALAAAPATADYGSCMEYCLEQYEFDHCHSTCSDTFSADGETTNSVSTSGEITGTVPQPDKVCALSRREREDVIWNWLKEIYGSIDGMGSAPFDADLNVFRVGFFVAEDDYGVTYCEGDLEIIGDCEVEPIAEILCQEFEK